MPEVAAINPELLIWARETAGLSLEEAATKLGLKNSTKANAADKLRSMESGDRSISEARLQKAADVYHRPLTSFYLKMQPTRGDRGEDFRTVTATAWNRDNALLDTLMRDVRARQMMVRELLIDEEDAQPLSFVASAKIEDGAPRVATAIRLALKVSEQQQQSAKGPEGLFSLLRTATERLGVYVLLLGDLGSHHSDISETVFRGFALADPFAPFVVINDNDAATARSFTLLHEVAHIWIGSSGVSGPLSAVSQNVIEMFCNSVAGYFLLPEEAVSIAQDLLGADIQNAQRAAAQIAELWNVSDGVVTYRFLSNGWITQTTASALFEMFRQRWLSEKQHQTASSSSGPTYYVVRRHRLGAALLSTVRRAIQDEAITHTRASKILGVSPASIDQLLQQRIRAA